MDSKIDDLNVNEVQGQNESCAPCSRPSDCYVPFSLSIARELRDKWGASPIEIAWCLKATGLFNDFKNMARRMGL